MSARSRHGRSYEAHTLIFPTMRARARELDPILYEIQNPMAHEEAAKIEAGLHEVFENAVILSFGGH